MGEEGHVMTKQHAFRFFALTLVALSLSACGTTVEDRAVSGAIIGAGVGAATAAVVSGSVLAGAAIGTAAGATAAVLSE